MTVRVRRLRSCDIAEVVALAIRAWEPVFDSMKNALGDEVFTAIYPDWLAAQSAAVEHACSGTDVWVAVGCTSPGAGASDPPLAGRPEGKRRSQGDAAGRTDGASPWHVDSSDPPGNQSQARTEDRPIGFVAVSFHHEGPALVGEMDMIAVDPQAQRHGVATKLIDTAVEHMRGQGAELAVVATGGDSGHEPARRSYEHAGFTPLPLVRYYRKL